MKALIGIVALALVVVLLLSSPSPPVTAQSPIPTPTNTPDPSPPHVTVDESSVIVNEGEFAFNSGTAVDPNGDRVSLIEASAGLIRGYDDNIWAWLFVAVDGPDDSQTVTIGASDEGGATGQATFELTVNNVAPVVVGQNIDIEPLEPVAIDQNIVFTAFVSDQGSLDTHVGVWAWDDEGQCSTDTGPDCTLEQSHGSGVVRGVHSYTKPGVYTILLTVNDDDGGVDEAISPPVVVYDPTGDFVTGGGWIDSPAGAYRSNPSLTGKATFGFVSKYKKGASVPTGKTEFDFKAGDLHFHSETYDWLLINQRDSNAQFKGAGTINGAGDYKFILWARDSQPDTFRIKIWEENDVGTEIVAYDNGDDQTISGGSIVIHK